MSPFGRKSHSRKASGAAVVGGGVRFFSHAQQQQPALFFLFFFQSRPRTVLTTFHFAWCSLSRDRQTASFLRARGGSGAVDGSGGYINTSIGPRLLPCILPLLSTFSQRKNICLVFLSLPICSIPALIGVCHHAPYKFSGLAAGKGGRIGAHVPQRCLRLPMCACAPLKQSD